MANHERHLSNYRSAQQRVNAAANFKVPGGSQKLDARLATEQMAALRANLRIIEMRYNKAMRLGNIDKAITLMSLMTRQQGHIQRMADAICVQWDRDDKWHKSNEDKGTILAQPRYRNEAERNQALNLSSKVR